MAMTSSGALKALIESAGLGLAAYRDAVPDARKNDLPYVTIDELVSVVPERHGDKQDPDGHHGETETVTVHLWERWRGDDGKAAENYSLPRELSKLLRSSPPFTYGSTAQGGAVRIYGVSITARARIIEEDSNIVHTTWTLALRRDA